MQQVRRRIPTAPERVYRVLADGWSYASWVVGAIHIRDVDPGWPAVGTRIHHSVGFWPLPVHDTSDVLTVDPGRALELRVKMWPFGEGKVRLELAPDGQGGTITTMSEEFTGGLGKLLPEPLIAPLLKARNRESLRRLTDLAVNREESPAHPSPATSPPSPSPATKPAPTGGRTGRR